MNTKHYVSLEAAKKLKELGYNEECLNCYKKGGGEKLYCSELPMLMNHNNMGRYSAPTLLEAMDWLESKGIHIEIRMQHCKTKGDPYQIADDDEYQWKWYYAICKGDDIKNPILEEGDNGYVLMHPDMVSCLRAAIRKGVELL